MHTIVVPLIIIRLVQLNVWKNIKKVLYKMKIQATKTQGTSIKGVTSETLKAMVLDIPPLKEQIHISKMLLSVDKRLKVELNTLNKMQTIKNGMLQQLFI